MAFKFYSTDYTCTGNPRSFSVSEIEDDPFRGEELFVRVERESPSGFDFAEQRLPSRVWTKCFGFSEDELFELSRYILNNQVLLWDHARGLLF